MTGRLWKLVRFEWQKLLARRFALVALLAVMAIAFLAPYLGSVVDEAQGSLARNGAASEGDPFEANGWVSLASGASWGLQIATYLVLLFAASSIAEESQLGTLKTLFTRPVRRIEVLLAKWLALSGYALALLVVSVLAAALAGKLRYGFGDVVDPVYRTVVKTSSADMLSFGVRALALSVPSLIALVSLGLLFSCAIDHPGYSVGASISSYFVLEVFTKLSARYGVYLFARYTLLAAEYFRDIARMFGEKGHFAQETPRLVLVPLASALIFFVGAAWLLQGREVGE